MPEWPMPTIGLAKPAGACPAREARHTADYFRRTTGAPLRGKSTQIIQLWHLWILGEHKE
jgi:hypothetical protein